MNYKNDFLTCTECLFSQKREAFAEGDTVLPDYYPPIMRIVGTEAVPSVRTSAVVGKKLITEGGVEFRVIYQAENGSINSVFVKLPYSDSAELQQGSEGIDENCFTDAVASADYFDCKALSPQKLRLKATVCLSLRVLAAGQVNILTAGEGASGVELRTEEVTAYSLACFGRKSLRLSDELPLQEGYDRLLRYDVTVLKGENKRMSRKLIAKAELVLKTVLWSDERKTAGVFEQKIPVSQLIEIPGMEEDTEAFVTVRVADARVEAVDAGEKKELSYDIELSVTVQGYKNEKKLIITDAYMPGKELSAEYCRALVDTAVSKDDKVSFSEKIEIPRGARVCDLSVKPRAAGIFTDGDGSVSVNGFFGCCVTAVDSEGELLFINRAVPFSVRSEGADSVFERAWGDAEPVVENLAFVAEGDSLEFRADCRICGSIFVSGRRDCVSKLTPGEAVIAGSGYPLTLFYAKKGESLWEIAKSYAVPLERLMSENKLSELITPDGLLSTDKMLLI